MKLFLAYLDVLPHNRQHYFLRIHAVYFSVIIKLGPVQYMCATAHSPSLNLVALISIGQ